MDVARWDINIDNGDSSGANDRVVVSKTGFSVNEKDITGIDRWVTIY